MDASISHRSGWVALCLTLLARMLLGVLASLLLWSVAPIAAGWHPTVVMTGSMMPRLAPGDVVFSRPVPATQIQRGQILLYDDPDAAHKLRMHRYVRTAADGRLITKGDANRTDDSTPITLATVHGVASLRVPIVARPVLWAQTHDVQSLAVTAAALTALVALACWFRTADLADAEANDLAEAEAEADGNDPDPTAEPADGPAGPGPEPTRPRRHHLPVLRPVGPFRFGRIGLFAGTTLTLLAVGLAFAGSARALAYNVTTANPTSRFSAATYYSCANAVVGAGAKVSWPLSEPSGGIATDISGNNTNGSYSHVTYKATGPCLYDATTGVTLNGTNSKITSSTAFTGTGGAVSLQVWFKTTSAHGGTLISLTTGTTTTMTISMTTTGTVIAGVNAVGTKTATTTTAYADGAWHLAVATVSSAGLTLYIDNTTPATNTSATTTATVAGTLNVGYGNHSSLGTGTNDYFTGNLAFATLYLSALTATQVAQQYTAAAA